MFNSESLEEVQKFFKSISLLEDLRSDWETIKGRLAEHRENIDEYYNGVHQNFDELIEKTKEGFKCLRKS